MLSSAEITAKLNAILRVLDSYPEAQQAFVAELKQVGFRVESPAEPPVDSGLRPSALRANADGVVQNRSRDFVAVTVAHPAELRAQFFV